MAEHGGYRRPSHPAPVSGPGALSRRTDGKQPMSAPTGLAYGDRQALMAQERVAPMSGDTSAPKLNIQSAPQQGGGGDLPAVGFGDPSTRPDEPVTHGVDIGPGGGPEALGVAPQNTPDGYLSSTLEQASTTDTTGLLGQLYLMAQQRGV